MGIKRAASASSIAVLTLGLASAAYQAVGEARDRRRQRPPGRLVDVGGCRLHSMCAGQGSPAVVAITALGGSGSSWLDVQRRLARETTVCVYDRAGIGWSNPPPKRRTGARMAAELHALLHNAGIQPPYVLVGHSIGGLLARIFACLYPDEVAGIALIDSSHPEQGWRLPKTELLQHRGGTLLQAAQWLVQPLGLQRLARDLDLRDAPHWARSANRRASAAELVAFKRIRKEVRGRGSLGNLPLAVLTSAEFDPTYSERAQRGRARFYPAWRILQDELTMLSSNSTHVVADHGGHYLNRQNPELVAEVIGHLVQRVRERDGQSGSASRADRY
jgi:pimeloyl-ACP methyl ester carboxylesterase